MVVLGGEVGDGTPAGTLRDSTLIEHFERSAEAGGDEVAFTFVDYASDPDGTRLTLTRTQLRTRVRAVAAQLQLLAQPGDRAAVLAGQGPDYVVGFLGAVHAGLIAVPLFAPDQPGQSHRLDATLVDCEPTVVVTGTADALAVRAYLDDQAGAGLPRPRLLAVDAVPDELADAWRDPGCTGDDVAYLQYTSGSTRVPAGVVITHRALLANSAQIAAAYDLAPGRSAAVSWLPLFHDMGLVAFVLLPVSTGIPATIMAPNAFVRRPQRWLQLLAEQDGAYTAAPDFAYQLCVRRARPADLGKLRLDGVHVMINGAEPVRPATIAAFQETFGPCGLSAGAHRPSYGMAEATVYITAAPPGRPPRLVTVDRDELGDGEVVSCSPEHPRALHLASCGHPIGQQLIVVDPDTGRVLDEQRVGEIWVRGPNVGSGYWRKPGESAAAFGARLAEPTPAGAAPGPWLRTGDLGAVQGGELFITGRLKDMIIVDGRNHYPQDVEGTVADSHPSIRRGYVAAFSVAEAAGPEGLVVVAECAPAPADAAQRDAIAGAVRRAIAERHGVSLRDLVLGPAGSVARTSSGKLARRASRQRYLDSASTLMGVGA